MSEQGMIWSNEYRAWWRPESRGYTIFSFFAGLYPLEEAESIVSGCPGKDLEVVKPGSARANQIDRQSGYGEVAQYVATLRAERDALAWYVECEYTSLSTYGARCALGNVDKMGHAFETQGYPEFKRIYAQALSDARKALGVDRG